MVPSIQLSTSADLRLPLRWVSLLHGKVKCSLAGTSGVHTGADAAKLILAGADVVMMCSALLSKGIGEITAVRDGLAEVASKNDYKSVEEMRGVMSHAKVAEPAAFERANYMKTLSSFGRTATLE